MTRSTMRRNCLLNRPHRGQALVFFALASIVLMGALGLAIDAGYNFGQRRTMQNAADAAALAGARIISQNTGSGAYPVLTAVRAAAAQNGVKDPSKVDCMYIKDDLSTNGECTDVIPAGATNSVTAGTTGVQVWVREEHATFVMTVLGIATSSTGATAAARVEVITGFLTGPFAVCGIDTAFTAPAGSTFGTGPDKGLYKTNGVYETVRPAGYYSCPDGPCKRTRESTDTSGPLNSKDSRPVHNDGIWYYDWSRKEKVLPDGTVQWPGGPLANPLQYPKATGSGTVNGPTFIIHDPNAVALCNFNANSFKGVNGINDQYIEFPDQKDYSPPDYRGTTIFPYTPSTGYAHTTVMVDPGTKAAMAADVAGVNGCQAGAAKIDKCILWIMIIDNSGPGGNSTTNNPVAAREFIAFYVEQVGANKHIGRAVKGYQSSGPSHTGFGAGTTLPLTIRLVK